MIDRVERFLRINEQNMKVSEGRLIVYRVVIQEIQFSYVIISSTARNEALLSRLQERLKGWSDRGDDPAGDDPVERVGDRERTGVVWNQEALLRQQEKVQ